MMASIILGLSIFTLIAGSQDGSVYSTVKDVWKAEIMLRTAEDVNH